ncbi:glutaredoxin domain-containing protein [Streptomyces sp. NPDC046759]|uniref:glutaredoxin domain-containing protein n=1 Tax=Streptomyces sp. NPDC046759 TaxID=3155019 RepID=UPI0033EE17C3
MSEEREGVAMYWQPSCVFCINLRLSLLFTGLRYTRRNIWRDKAAAAFVRSVADGNETVPTVTVAGHAMVNPSKRKLLDAARTHRTCWRPDLAREDTGPLRSIGLRVRPVV